ncbi:50S ribosomal protein L1 [Microbotryum lychnidis-dioicae p1A1 Lamole]|uniref:50S ribosomal protein L1 n=2 Tax=Microbotryum TaxID=34416 RepID=U5GZW9_USTV1|nr:50S ribosomal protein L1 [Microbotryum lychnidis-dioicae p1A1 Lamole]SGY79087.1 BQ5605_C008g05035 [Microbotryum silenes-dioicae]|eukprot:KDE08991.1 50S ribosomal protein L1 [Microbotryum lychnidis-dioicae p1A1 Lamole]
MSIRSVTTAVWSSPLVASTIGGGSPRSFSCTASTSAKKVLSPLHKTSIERARRAERLSGGSASGSQTNSMILKEAARTLQALSPTTPNAAFEINITTKPVATVQLNALRGRVFLPHSCMSATKSTLLVVFASGPAAAAARQAGADVVGGEELIPKILNGELSPDKLLTTSELLPLIQRNPTLARMLGPKGLMPSVKRGTVVEDVAKGVQEARNGLDWKGDSKGVVRAAIGRLHFNVEKLQDNVHTLLASVSDISLGGSGAVKDSAARAKRPAITRVMLSSTQGPGIFLADV